jgi:hypothetical protein
LRQKARVGAPHFVYVGYRCDIVHKQEYLGFCLGFGKTFDC